jgi:hypothetical protein
MPRLLPGVLALSDRARYLSFHAFLLRRYAEQRRAPNQAELTHYIKTREFEYALAVGLCPRCNSGPVGSSRTTPLLTRNVDPIPRGESVESHLGGYGLYYRSPMRTLGLAATAGTPTVSGDPTPVDVLWPGSARAQRLASLFAEAVHATEYFREYIDSSEAIPRSVLAEYGSVGCLCRLGEYAAEQAELRDAFFAPSDEQNAEDVASRRQGFALWLDLWSGNPGVEDDAGLRRSVWNTFEASVGSTGARARALARWAGLAAKDYIQEALANVWVDAGAALGRADGGDGLASEGIRAVANELASAGLVLPDAESQSTARATPSSEFRARVLSALEDRTLPEAVTWARSQASALAGVALLLTVVDRLPASVAASEEWTETAGLSGERQPAPLAIAQYVAAHLTERPTLGETMLWVIQRFVLRPHETIAYSKLPEFTFRFRHEGARLRTYPLPHDRFGLNNIRAGTMATLTQDLGMRQADGSLAPPGELLVREEFG